MDELIDEECACDSGKADEERMKREEGELI